MTPEELAEIRARAEAATPGPWVVESGNWTGGEPWHQYRPAVPVKGRMFGGEPLTTEEDAEFCAHARTDVPRLLAAYEEATRTAEECRSARDLWEGRATSEQTAWRLAAEAWEARATQAERQRDEALARADALAAAVDAVRALLAVEERGTWVVPTYKVREALAAVPAPEPAEEI